MQAASGHFYDNIVYKPSTGFRFFAPQQKSGRRPQTMTSGVKNAAKRDEPSATVGDSPLVARYAAALSHHAPLPLPLPLPLTPTATPTPTYHHHDP